MIKVHDTITDLVFEYDDIEDFRAGFMDVFDMEHREVVDQLCDAYSRHEYIGDLEVLLGVEIEMY